MKSAENSCRRDFDWALGLNRLTLDMIGVWPRDSHGDDFLRNLRIPLMVLCMIFGLFVPQMYALTKVYCHLPLVVDNLITSCAVLVSSTKIFMIWYRRKVLQEVIDTVTSDWLQKKTEWERETMLNQAYRARLFTMTGYGIMIFCLLGFYTLPIFGLSIRQINNITDAQRYFPLQTSYPYEAHHSPYFELTYLSQLIAGGFTAMLFSISDNFFGALVFHACGQCEILERRFERMMTCEDDIRVFGLELRRLVQMHIKIINFVADVEISFNMLILAHVMCLTVMVGCIGFSTLRSIGNEAENLPLMQIITLAMTLINTMMHMFIYCVASEILANHSSTFFKAIYQSSIWRLSETYIKDLIIIMIRSQSPLQLTAGKFFNLSLNTYMQFVKNTVAYISMLLTVSS